MIKKIFKWYIVSDLDLFIEKDMACKTLNRRIMYLEKENENLYFENVRLRNEQIQVTNIIEPKDITLKKYISEDKIIEIIEHYNNELEHIKNGEEFENEKPMYYWGKVALENLLEEK